MGALPKRRISTGRSGRRRQDKTISTGGRGAYMSSRTRRLTKQGKTTQE
jgi:hypothetical protein